MKKIIYSLLLLLAFTFPIKVFAAGSITTSDSTITVAKGSTKTFDIIVNNAFGFADIYSLDESIATIDENYLDTGTGLEGKEGRFTITVTGVAVGRTTVTIEMIDMITYDFEDLTEDIDININVVEDVYTVTYNGNGGTPGRTSDTVTKGNSLQLPNATRSGYTFNGWYTAATGGTKVGTVGLFYDVKSDITLYAQWTATPTTYEVKFDANGGTTATSSLTVDVGKSIKLPSATRAGYTLSGWYTAATGGSSFGIEGTSFTPTSDITLYAQWTVNIQTYTVSFNTMSGTPSTINPVTAQAGTTIPLPSVTRSGYEFLGWSTTIEEKDIVGGVGYSYKPQSNVTLYAIWKTNTYKVLFDENGGSITTSSLEVEVGKSITLPSATKTNYEFLGWSTSSNESDIVGKSGASYTPTSDITLIAIWKQNPYKVTFNVNGGSTANSSVMVEVGDSITLPNATKTNYEFLGWSTTTTAPGIVGKGGTSYTPQSDITLTAIWQAVVVKPTTYSVSFNVNGGNETISTQNVDIGKSITLPSVTRSGFEFLGWSTSSNESDIVGKAGASYTPKENVTLIAVWKQNPYKITFNVNGGVTADSSLEVEVGKSITLPSATKANYAFLGWSTNTDETGIIGQAGASYTPQGNETLTAIWKEVQAIEYVVTYNATGGKDAPNNQIKTKDQDLVLSTKKPIKDKYEFIGWNTKEDGSGDEYSVGGKYTKNADVTLYAQWKLVDNVDKNPQTGDSTIFIILAIMLTFGGYAFWYTKKAKEN